MKSLDAERYSRQLLLWGEKGQEAIAAGSVLVAGVGGLGGTVAQLLARTGVGTLVIIDAGTVDLPDLNRQTLFDECDLGRKKIAVASEKIRRINSGIKIIPLDIRIDRSFTLPPEISVIAECLDSFTSRFDLYRAAPPDTLYVHGGIFRDQGQVVSLRKGTSQPLDSIFAGCGDPVTPIPVAGPTPAVVAGIMSGEIIDALLGQPKLLDRLLVVDLYAHSLSVIDVSVSETATGGTEK